MSRIRVFIYCLLLGCILAPPAPAPASDAAARDKYARADACRAALLKNKNRMQHRQDWQVCIDKFMAVYRQDPSGGWAAAGLYMAANLQYDLYEYSGMAADRKESFDLYRRIIKRFPSSQYRKRAEKALQTYARAESTSKSSPATSTAKGKYLRGKSCYEKLQKNTKKQKFRHNWTRCIERFEAAHRRDPEGPWAAASRYRMAELYLGLYKHSRKSSDRKEAIRIFRKIVADFPESRYHSKASEKLDALAPGRAAPAARPAPPPSPRASEPGGGGKREVSKLRFWSNPSYTRVVIDVDAQTTFKHRLLNKDPAHDKPQRIYVDLDKCRLAKNIEKKKVVNDNLLSDIRLGQNTRDTVRAVVDIKTFEKYNVFSLRNPFRVVIDVWGKARDKAPTTAASARPEIDDDLPPSALTRQLALGVSRIIIDPGHGGKDHGAPGFIKGVREKDVVLAIGKKLAEKIQKTLKCEVVMTRTRDTFLSLEERTALANTRNGDLFISIHTNAHKNRGAYGIETYFLNLATDDEAILVAARENATSAKNISDLESILNDLMQNAKINESSRLAAHIQDSVYGNLRKRYKKVKSKGVKQAPFYVLLGAQMPAVLIETSFISNKRECKRLTNAKYQDRLCEGILNGIRKYIDETAPSAFAIPLVRDGAEG